MFLLPQRQNLSMEGLRIGHRPAPPFSAMAICARVSDPWESSA
jgi:hypothetical protein